MTSTHPTIITIDGHASSGKSSVAQQVAQTHNLRWMSSGKLYRMVGLMAYRQNFLPQHSAVFNNPSYQAKLTNLVNHLRAELTYQPNGTVRLNHVDYTTDLGHENTGKYASFVAKDPLCRQLLSDWQRQIAINWQQEDPQCKGIIFEGRDMGTVVFTHAAIKFFLTCDLLTKARRRWGELYPNQPPKPAELQQLSISLEKRDARDIYRKIAPLKPAADAHIIDTTHKNFDDVVAIVSKKIMPIINQNHSLDSL